MDGLLSVRLPFGRRAVPQIQVGGGVQMDQDHLRNSHMSFLLQNTCLNLKALLLPMQQTACLECSITGSDTSWFVMFNSRLDQQSTKALLSTSHPPLSGKHSVFACKQSNLCGPVVPIKAWLLYWLSSRSEHKRRGVHSSRSVILEACKAAASFPVAVHWQ